MKKNVFFIAFCYALIFASCSSKNEPYIPPVVYDNTFILNFEKEKTTIGYLNKDAVFTPNVYTSANGNALSFNVFENNIYVVSQGGPSYVSQLNLETLALEKEISKSEVSKPSNLLMYSNTDGLIVSSSGRGRRKKYNLSHVNLLDGIGAKIEGISTKMLPSNSAMLIHNNNVLLADGNDLKAMDISSKKITTLLTFKERISGIIKDDSNIIWVATERRTENAAFTKLTNDYAIAETVKISDESIKLFINSILFMNNGSNTAYWSEASSGKIYKFNTQTKLVEEFITPSVNGILLTTLVKEHPTTKQVYVLGLEDFTNTDKSVLLIYNKDKTLDKTIKNVGVSPIDIYFSDKNFIKP